MHPTSVVHSMVEFVDGSTLAQASPPTMLIPIALGLAWPDRVPDAAPPVDWTTAQTWEFFPLDDEAFPAVRLARDGGRARRHRPGGLQRRQRGLRRGVPRRAAGVRRHRRHGRATVLAQPRRTLERRSHRRRRARRRCLGPRRAARLIELKDRPMTALLYTLGVLLFVVGVLASIGLHEIGHLIPAQAVQRQGHPVLRRLRPHRVVQAARRDRVRRQGDPARRLLQARRDAPAGRAADEESTSRATGCSGPQANTGHVRPAGHRRPRGGVGARRPEDERPAVLQQAVVEEGHHHGRRAHDQPADRVLPLRRRLRDVRQSPTATDRGRPVVRRASIARAMADREEPPRVHAPPTRSAPAQAAGFRPGDRIVSFNGTAVTSWDQVQRADPRQRRRPGRRSWSSATASR